MEATVSAASTLRLLSCRTGLSGASTLAEGVDASIALEVATGAGSCAGPLNAPGFANAVGVALIETGALVAGTFWRPRNRPASCRDPQDDQYYAAPHGVIDLSVICLLLS